MEKLLNQCRTVDVRGNANHLESGASRRPELGDGVHEHVAIRELREGCRKRLACGRVAEETRATQVAPNEIASSHGSTAWSGFPYVVDFVLSPIGVVGAAWPLVRP